MTKFKVHCAEHIVKRWSFEVEANSIEEAYRIGDKLGSAECEASEYDEAHFELEVETLTEE